MNFLPHLRLRGLGPVLAVLLVVSMAACHRTTYRMSAVGHDISAWIQGDLRSVETLPDRAIICGGGGTVTIERVRVRIDDNPWTAIPADSAIEITIHRRSVRVTAGRVTIERSTSD